MKVPDGWYAVLTLSLAAAIGTVAITSSLLGLCFFMKAFCLVPERLLKRFKKMQYAMPVGEKIALTASLGVATFTGESAEALLACADKALYGAKTQPA